MPQPAARAVKGQSRHHRKIHVFRGHGADVRRLLYAQRPARQRLVRRQFHQFVPSGLGGAGRDTDGLPLRAALRQQALGAHFATDGQVAGHTPRAAVFRQRHDGRLDALPGFAHPRVLQGVPPCAHEVAQRFFLRGQVLLLRVHYPSKPSLSGGHVAQPRR